MGGLIFWRLQMKPIWKDGKLSVELHRPDEQVLCKALAIGKALVAMNQETGQPLVDAINAIFGEDDTNADC